MSALPYKEERLTREEWEALEVEEYAASRRRAKERGDWFGTLHVSGDDIRRMKREQVESLMDAKLAQFRLVFLCDVYGEDEKSS